MNDQELLQMMVAEPWDAYHRAGWKGRLDLLRHTFSMNIAHADETYEDLHIVLDGHTELKYMVNKAAAVSDDHTVRGFIRVANWARDAFEGCACEGKYLRLRNAGQ